jgi:phosphoglycolate phosphatase-like HAD superfamily hydrolase
LRDTLDTDDAVHAATSSTDTGAGKPAPDIVQAALEQCDLEPRQVVFVGDSVWDGQAAGHLDVPFVAVTCGGTSEAELRENGAVEVWRDPADVLANFGTSALGRLAAP